MDDLLKNLAIGCAAFLVIHGSLERRLQRDATQQVHKAFGNTGTVRTRIALNGPLGVFSGDLRAVDIDGENLIVRDLPFYLMPNAERTGSIHHLRLHLRDVTLSGLPIARFEVDVPDIRFDIGSAIGRNRLMISRVGSGPAEARIEAGGLRRFILQKYEQILSDVVVWTQNRRLYFSGNARLFLSSQPFTADCLLVPRAGRYVDLIDARIVLNGVRLTPLQARNLITQLNPVLDIEKDLGLGGFLSLTQVEIDDGFVRLEGRATLPPAPNPTSPPSARR